jgi:hypothetical protein
VDDDFFRPPPAPREPEAQPPSPPWTGPPYGVLPGAVALELVVAQNEQVAVYIGRCAAYPTGLDFELHVLAAASAGQDLDPSLNGIYHRPGRKPTYEEMLRFGVAFADGIEKRPVVDCHLRAARAFQPSAVSRHSRSP